MTSSLRITWSGGDRTFPAGTTISIGRDPAATIRLNDERVSRRHAELRSTPDGWMLTDLGSTSGTFVGGQQVHEVLLRTSMTVRFGGVSSNEDVSFAPVADMTAPGGFASNPTELAAPVLLEPTVLPGPATARPGGVLSPNAAAGATEVAGATLNVQFGGASRTLHPGEVVHVGRGGTELSTENPTVSRNHVALTYQNDGWYVEDTGSTRGTFLDGKKITRQLVKGSMAFVLGPPDTGERLVVVAAGTADESISKKLRNPRVLALVSLGAVIIAVLALAGVLLVGGGDDDATVSAAELRSATVFIEAGNFTGSGTIIDGDRGLILTNAHVVSPDAPGQVLIYGEDEEGLPESPKEVLVYLSSGADATAEPKYRAEVVAVDGYLDLAVIKVTATSTGTIIDDDEDLGLPEVPLGDSEGLDLGDPLIMVGYPVGAAGSLAAQSDDATVSGFAVDKRLQDNRAWINSSVNISSGNSGGLAADADGRLIGVPSAERSVNGDEVSQIRPIHLALDLIEAARQGNDYTSPFVTPAKNEKITITGYATPGNAFSTACRNRATDSLTSTFDVSLMFDYEDFPVGHQDLVVVVLDEAGNALGSISSADDWPVKWNSEGCAVISVPLDTPFTPGTNLLIGFLVGPNNEVVLGPETIPV